MQPSLSSLKEWGKEGRVEAFLRAGLTPGQTSKGGAKEEADIWSPSLFPEYTRSGRYLGQESGLGHSM